MPIQTFGASYNQQGWASKLKNIIPNLTNPTIKIQFIRFGFGLETRKYFTFVQPQFGAVDICVYMYTR